VTASTATTRTRGNATITIRNASTQQEESTDRVATRRLFKARQSSETTTRIAPGTGTTVKTTLSPAMVKAPATAPATALIPTTPTTKAAKPDQHDYAPTDAKPTARLIGTQPSILLAPEIDDSVPETTQVRIARREGRELARQGFTLLEVMITLAILATVLASVGSGIFALTSAKQSAREETTVSDLMRSWAERMMGADWEWLGRDRIDDPLRQAWSWQRPETTAPLVRGNYPPLKEDVKDPTNNAAVQVLGTEHSGLTDLRLYLEYYQPIALELCFSPIDGAAARSLWADTRGAYQLVPPIDLRQQIDAVVVRLSATWTSQNGGQRRRELVFARTK
jgi:prepilin-type N-terminal cleavage/methylation domain-containing protein